jgi:hypothetical protein
LGNARQCQLPRVVMTGRKGLISTYGLRRAFTSLDTAPMSARP